MLKKKRCAKDIKMKKQRTLMPEQDSSVRANNFDEVNLGYIEEQAVEEASRCIQCLKPKCIEGCPVGIDIPKFIRFIKDKKFDKAIKLIKKTNNLPAICGRVCPQEDQCEKLCILGIKSKPIAIGHLERFAADNESDFKIPAIKKKSKNIAVIGSGPASLTCASDLALRGYNVTIFEALHKPGGVLTYGIPEFRLPKRIVEKEIGLIKKLGIEFKKNMIIGRIFTIEELLEEFDAIFIGTGAGLPHFLRIPGENLVNVYTASEFLTRVNLMKAYKFPEYKTPIKKAEKTVVIGGGNVAMDAARIAKRLGAEVTIVYRRSLEEMSARDEEIKHAQEENIKFMLLTSPSRILGKEKVEGIELIQMMLGEKDETGRRRPIPIENSEFIVKCDQVIIAIGQGPNPLIKKTSNLEHDLKGYLIVNESLQTSNEKVFAGGDIIGEEDTVIKAMADGKKAAKEIENFLKQRKLIV